MEIELQGMHPPLRAQHQPRLRNAKATLARYKKLSKDQHAQLSRSMLLSSPGLGPSSDEPYGSSSDRTRLLAGTALLEDGAKRLQESHRIALETEGQGADILLNLRTQREQIEHSRDTVNISLCSSVNRFIHYSRSFMWPMVISIAQQEH
jgi:vesicle transport through interaction with t-SNAREs protein 1